MWGRVMAPSDWRSSAEYESLRSLDAPGFAWEYLNRNPDFQHDLRLLAEQQTQGQLSPDDQAGFARHWGLRFPSRPSHPSAEALLDAGRSALRPAPGSCSAGVAEFGRKPRSLAVAR